MTANSFLELTLFVSDVDRSAGFYRALGLNLSIVDEPGHPHHYEGGVRGTCLQIYPADSRAVTRVQLGLRVVSIEDVAARFDELGTPYELPLPKRLVTRDPDGNRVHLSEAPPFE